MGGWIDPYTSCGRQGASSTLDELTASAFLTVELDRSLGGNAVQVGLTQIKMRISYCPMSMNVQWKCVFCFIPTLLQDTHTHSEAEEVGADHPSGNV